MPLQNRVMPWGEIIADPARGTLTGNRGILHRPDRTLGTARWRHKAWIACCLRWKDVRRVPMSPGTWTELFFLDEAIALSAGHRPCALCRRTRFRAFQAAWRAAGLGPDSAPAIDRCLHAARIRRADTGATHSADCNSLPDGTIIIAGGTPALILGNSAYPFAPPGYLPPVPRPHGIVPVLTPQPIVAVLGHGYHPDLHPTAPGH